MISSNPLVSIIIPCLDSERYLGECLESVLRQNYPLFEVLICDGGSSDNTIAIANRFAERDSRFVILISPKKGVSVQRNMGIDAANGDVVSFLDSDDVLHPEFLSAMVYGFKRHRCDVAISGYLEFDGDAPPDSFGKITHDADVSFEEYPDALREFYNDSYNRGYLIACAKVYSRSFIGNRRFQEGVCYGEDTDFNFFLFQDSIKICRTIAKLYGYRFHLSNTVVIPKNNLLTVFDALESQLAELESQRPDLLGLGLQRLYWTLNTLYLMWHRANRSFDKKTFAHVRSILVRHKKVFGEMSFGQRFFLCFPKMYCVFHEQKAQIVKRQKT